LRRRLETRIPAQELSVSSLLVAYVFDYTEEVNISRLIHSLNETYSRVAYIIPSLLPVGDRQE